MAKDYYLSTIAAQKAVDENKADQVEAEEGADNEKWMTPLRVHQAIDAKAANVNFVRNNAPRQSLQDYAGTSRHAAWVSGAITMSGSITQAHVQNILLVNGPTIDLPTAAAISAQTGCLITMLATVEFTITPTGGSTLTWYDAQGGQSGPRTVAATSVITVCATSTSAWAIWGNGIS